MVKKSVYKFNKKDIQGGAGRLITGTDPSFRPKAISDIMDEKTYDLKDGFRDLGATQEGISQSRSFETEDIEIDQSLTAIDTAVSSFSSSISTTLAETSIDNRQLANIGGAITETAASLGTAEPILGEVVKGAKRLKIATTNIADFKDVRFIKIGDETKSVANVDDTGIITLDNSLDNGYTTTDSVYPVTKLGTKTISYGAPTNLPAYSLTLICQRDNGTLLMVHYYEVKLSGDDVESTFDKNKRQLPIGFTAFSQDDLPEDENVYIEVEETL